ncbi:hypothetical protein SARC_03221 [Sphaeroforma arctica JP610]|uniref:Uncharacterized protein n=1 Tax=Sphaeroforma arctica JP610 TaxID=667725 RepID=A0A0L0G6N6_9EUKA|nr:hypothetical protein SARC_03221 [Sphaeroforma arctica JP610]KNC84579.1 hypothetical protein SARC_03221 [Sphaeroforma arctica JP610]|eukprot:XP_014158481.1 hypothetical protein SARC_03221 [Sphaeroforma arctica JP610]
MKRPSKETKKEKGNGKYKDRDKEKESLEDINEFRVNDGADGKEKQEGEVRGAGSTEQRRHSNNISPENEKENSKEKRVKKQSSGFSFVSGLLTKGGSKGSTQSMRVQSRSGTSGNSSGHDKNRSDTSLTEHVNTSRQVKKEIAVGLANMAFILAHTGTAEEKMRPICNPYRYLRPGPIRAEVALGLVRRAHSQV